MKRHYEKPVIVAIDYDENDSTKDNNIHYKTLKRNGTTYYFNKGGGKYAKPSHRQRY